MMEIDKVRDVEELKALYEARPMQTDLFSFEHILNNPNLFCFYSTIGDRNSFSRTRSRPAPAIVSKRSSCQPESDDFSAQKKGGELRGFIFITQDKDGKLYLSGVSVPKNLPDNRDAIIKVCEAFKQDIYADTDLKHAVFMLKLAGFKHYEGNIYVRPVQCAEQGGTAAIP